MQHRVTKPLRQRAQGLEKAGGSDTVAARDVFSTGDAMSGKKPKNAAAADTRLAPGELGYLLARIEAEPVPERLLQLVLELQKALAERRLAADAASTGLAPGKRAEARL